MAFSSRSTARRSGCWQLKPLAKSQTSEAWPVNLMASINLSNKPPLPQFAPLTCATYWYVKTSTATQEALPLLLALQWTALRAELAQSAAQWASPADQAAAREWYSLFATLTQTQQHNTPLVFSVAASVRTLCKYFRRLHFSAQKFLDAKCQRRYNYN